jgi:inosine-uridine nucleoside N-ribohydrolase
MVSRRVIIDTDPGIDDAQAILFALFCGEFQIEALTTVFGNVPATTAAANALRLIEMGRTTRSPRLSRCGRATRSRTVCATPSRSTARWLRGTSGCRRRGARLKRRTPQSNWHEESSTNRAPLRSWRSGPLTNIALAIRLEPRFVESVHEIILMGGIVAGHGNVSAVATANVLNDSEAARIVFNAGFRSLTMVGQDVTRATRLLPERRERLGQCRGDIARVPI